MQNEIVTDKYSNARPKLTQPHFDEEATVLSARPVVPLAAVEARTDNRRSLVLAGTIAIAVVLGVLGGTLSYFRGGQPVTSKQIVEEGAQTSRATGDGTETIADAEIQERDVGVEEIEAPLEQPVERLKLKKTKAVVAAPSLQPDSDDPKGDRAARPKAQLFGVIRQRKASSRKQHSHETREEQRPRRVGSRQSSGRNASPDDLFRIGEIFEGSRP